MRNSCFGKTNMKDKFSEYYKLDDGKLKEHWEKDTFSFDANVLLNLYRYTPKTRDAFFDLFEIIKDRIWISYQAAYEYQKNRLKVINAQKEAYNEIRQTLESKKGEIEAKLNKFKKHPYLQTSELKTQIESAFKSISKDLDKLEEDHPDFLDYDPIWEKLTDLLDSRIGDDFKNDDLEKIYKEGKKRYDEKIPPGYKDLAEKKNEGNRSLYGDIIVWKQIIKKAQDISESIIFITDDLKEDWWYKFKGKTISPRPELIKEFREETKKYVNIYQADRFLELANKNLKQHTAKEAIEEVRKVRLAFEHEIAEEIKKLEMLLEDNGDENFRENAKRIAEFEYKSTFEKAIDENIKKNDSNNK